MPSLRDIKRRIKSVQNTQQITRAMEMVAAARLRKAQQRVEAARPYGLKMQQMLESLAAAAAGLHHPLFEEREVKTTLLVVITSDRGLAGSYNSNIIRNATRYLAQAPRDASGSALSARRPTSFSSADLIQSIFPSPISAASPTWCAFANWPWKSRKSFRGRR